MSTLVHEDIYVYIDPITEVSVNLTAANSFTFSNTATEQIADLGVFTIDIVSGSYTKLVITAGGKSATFNIAMATGNQLVLDFRNNHFKKGTTLLFADDLPILTDNTTENITITLTGTGSTKVTRVYERVTLNNNDIWFVEGVSYDTNIERLSKKLVNGTEKTIKGEKKVHSFSINGLWSKTEVDKFSSKFRMRLVDDQAIKIATLANCYRNGDNRASSAAGDFTYTISGTCEKIF
ncbi:hypothetical protein [Microcystis phage MaeS]|nr:hypothetical protein [Microcystis phage MaeS]